MSIVQNLDPSIIADNFIQRTLNTVVEIDPVSIANMTI